MENDERLEDHLKMCQPTFDCSRNESRLTIEFGSRKRGERALQTSWMAPSSDQVAAMMGSMYCFCPGKLRAETKGGENEGAHLRLWGGSFWFASVLDDLFK